MLGILPKKYLVGAETEYFVLDSDGRISNNADVLLERTAVAKKECGKNMVEVVSMPAENIAGVAGDLLGKARTLMETAEKNGLKIFNCGTYPGMSSPEMRRDGLYVIKERIYGSKIRKIDGRCVGFHCHYTLSRGIFDDIRKSLKLILLGNNQAFVDSYNMLIALDAVFATFLQSSPFYQGKLYGKDARMMFYRGNLGVNGVYTNLPDFGALPKYENVVTDIMYLAEHRFETWSRMMKRAGINADPRKLYDSIYDVNWSPVRVNPIGTFELRGMDMNRFELLTSAAALIRHVLKSIHDGGIRVAVSEGAKEPFGVEDEKVYLAPFAYMDKLQKYSATKGMESTDVRNYCGGFLRFMKAFLPDDGKKFLSPFRKMISARATVSDEIIREAKRMGVKKAINAEEGAELSLKLAEKIPGDMDRTEKLIGGLS